MGVLATLLPGVLFVAIGFLAAALFVRNERVFAYRKRVLTRVGALAREDIAAGRTDWMRWFDLYATTSYDEMVSRFWRPMASFIPPEIRPESVLP